MSVKRGRVLRVEYRALGELRVACYVLRGEQCATVARPMEASGRYYDEIPLEIHLFYCSADYCVQRWLVTSASALLDVSSDCVPRAGSGLRWRKAVQAGLC